MSLFRRSATCALTVTLVTLGYGLAARAQVGVTQRTPVAAVGVEPVGAGISPVKSVGGTGVTPVGAGGGVQVSGVNTGVSLLINQIAAGQMTMNEAWDKGLLDAPKVLQLLGQSQRLTEDARNETLQRDMAGLLVRLAPATVATPETLSARIRVALCRYYSSVGDARAVPLCEALIAEKLDGKQVNQPLASNPDGGNSSLYLSSVICLAQYYQNVGQWQKEGETWERALTFWQDVSWWQAGVRIDAARAYTQAGEPEKTRGLYAQVSQCGQGWYIGLALIDQAQNLMRVGKYQQARVFLESANQNKISDQAKLAIKSVLAYSYFKTNDLPKAYLLSAEVIKTFEKSPESFLQVIAPVDECRYIVELCKPSNLGEAHQPTSNQP